MTKFDVVSDLHVDHWMHKTRIVSDDGPRSFEPHPDTGVERFVHFDFPYYKNPNSDVLIIAGDFCNGFKYGNEVLFDASRAYKHVIFTDGNHEHYNFFDYDKSSNTHKEVGYPVEANICRINSIAEKYPNVHYLSGSSKTPCWVVIGDTMFIGANGWYDFRAYAEFGISVEEGRRANNGINDGNYISWKTGQFNSFVEMAEKFAHLNALTIANAVSEAQSNDDIKNIVVVTHTVPDVRLNPPKYFDREYDSVSTSYINSQMLRMCQNADTHEKIKAWVYGHTHNRKYTEIDGIQFINNSYGTHRDESSKWFMVEIEV